MPQQLIGTVVGTKMQKTAMVLVFRWARHKKYPKMIKYRKKYLVHDEASACKLGDRVKIQQCRPMSKHKKFKVTDIVVHAPQFVSGHVKAKDKDGLSFLAPEIAEAYKEEKEDWVRGEIRAFSNVWDTVEKENPRETKVSKAVREEYEQQVRKELDRLQGEEKWEVEDEKDTGMGIIIREIYEKYRQPGIEALDRIIEEYEEELHNVSE